MVFNVVHSTLSGEKWHQTFLPRLGFEPTIFSVVVQTAKYYTTMEHTRLDQSQRDWYILLAHASNLLYTFSKINRKINTFFLIVNGLHLQNKYMPATWHQLKSVFCNCRLTMASRFCLSEVRRNHCTALFSKESQKDDLSARFSVLLLVDLSQDGQLSPYICRKCKSNFQSLESKLETFRCIAKVSQERLLSASTPQQVSRSPVCRKRVKDTSGSLLACLPTQLKLDHSQSVLRLEDFSQTCVSESMSVYDINE